MQPSANERSFPFVLIRYKNGQSASICSAEAVFEKKVKADYTVTQFITRAGHKVMLYWCR